MKMTVRLWLGFGTLCLLTGSGWLLDEWRPSEWNGVRQLFFYHLVGAALFAAVSTWLQAWPVAWRGWLRLVTLGGLGVVLFAVPTLVLAGSTVGSTTGALIFLGLPAVVVFVEAQNDRSFGREQNWLSLLMPALTGLFGASLILPFAWPAGGSTQMRLVLLVVSLCGAGWAVVRMHQMMASEGDAETKMALSPSLAAISGLIALVAAPFALSGQAWTGDALKLETLRCVGYELPTILLTGWLLRQMRPASFAARAFLAIGHYAARKLLSMLRPGIAWTMALGIGLLLLGGAGLLREDTSEGL